MKNHKKQTPSVNDTEKEPPEQQQEKQPEKEEKQPESDITKMAKNIAEGLNIFKQPHDTTTKTMKVIQKIQLMKKVPSTKLMNPLMNQV